ncbi:MAG TPA: segregation/condensation protein A, partial [Micromonosporaceae bacterium]
AAFIASLEASGAARFPRVVGLEAQYADVLPELVLGIGPQRFAALAAKAMTPKPIPSISTEHLHLVRVSVREHAAILRRRLIRTPIATFRTLCADCQSTLEIVARFLALLELYRESLVAFEQIDALGELTVRWTGGDDADGELDIDEYAGTPAERPGDGQPSAESAGQSDGPATANAASEATRDRNVQEDGS